MKNTISCINCEGSGYITYEYSDDYFDMETVECMDCGGTGEIEPIDDRIDPARQEITQEFKVIK